MEDQAQDPAQEVKRLERCINDLVGVLALPAIWHGSEPSQIVQTLLDVLLRMLGLEFAYARLNDAFDVIPVEVLRVGECSKITLTSQEICSLLADSLAADAPAFLPQVGNRLGVEEISIFPVPLGIQGEIGVIVLGCDRAGFPEKTESLLLSVAASQASIGLQEARLLSEQKRIANELDRRVTERTAELAAANAELQLQVGLLQHLPVSAWTLEPDGTPDFVNQVWLKFSGQTLDFVHSHPEAWMTAVHPEDRKAASETFWEAVRSGKGFSFETRSLRAKDGTYRWHLQQAVVLRDGEGKVLKYVGTTTDIDDQKRAQEELRANEGKLQRVIDAIPTLAWCNLPDGSNEFLSKSWHAYTGLSPEEAQGWGWRAAFHPEDLPPLMEKWGKMLVSGESGEIEARLRRHDGVYRWFLIRAQAFRDDSGKIVRWYGTSTDIELRKQAEQKLRQEERELKRSEVHKAAILDSSPDCVVAIDHQGLITEFNPAAELTFGYRREDVLGRPLADVIIPPSLRERHRMGFARHLTTGESRVLGRRVEMAALRADGSEFPVELTIARIPQEGAVAFTGHIRDITERKRSEDALRATHAELVRSEERWRSVFESSAVGVALADVNYRFTAANTIFQQILGYTEQELRQLTFIDITHEEYRERNKELARELLEGQRESFLIEKLCRRKDGTWVWVRNNVSLVPGTERVPRCLMALSEDVTQRKISEEALAKARSELAKVSSITSLGVLTASMAHEVNQPLSGIITNAGTCLRMLSADPPNVEGARETVRRTIRDGNRASDVVTRLRTLYSKKEPALESMDLNEAAREVAALSAAEIQRNGVTLRQELADDLPPALGDRIQLQQVMLNLLRNASDAMRTIDDRPRELIIRTERDEGNQLRLSVKDSGVGLTPQAAEKIFEAFYTTKTDGMGIGLSISRSIIEAHQGRLWATQNDGPGSTFSFSIPCLAGGSDEAELPADRDNASADAA
jgi:PAS domain S-box-containing protein